MVYVPFDAGKYDFSNAALYRKTALLHKDKVQVASGGEVLHTVVNGFAETANKAAAGDRIITGPLGEHYIVRAKEFARLYEPHPHDPDFYCAKTARKVLFLTEDTMIRAAWGSKQYIKAGGAIVLDGNHVYGVEEQAFYQTYSPVNPRG